MQSPGKKIMSIIPSVFITKKWILADSLPCYIPRNGLPYDFNKKKYSKNLGGKVIVPYWVQLKSNSHAGESPTKSANKA